MISLVEVYTPVKGSDVRAGIARFNLRRGSISATFTYDDEFLANSCSYAIDPHMPLSDKTHHIRGLPGAFRDSAPDRWGRNLILRQSRAEALGRSMVLRAFDEVDFLISVFDQTRQGALRYRSSPDATWLSPHRGIPPIIQLPALLQASKQLAQEAEGKEALKLLLDAGSGSLGGARPKASVMDGDRLLIAKFSHPTDDWDVLVWEKTSLDIAQAAGIRTPESRLVKVGTERVLLLERFDRIGSLGAGARLPYISAMSLLASEDGSTSDYTELAEAISFFVADPNKEILELMTRIALMIALHNTDDHMRNHGFLKAKTGWALSPIFDINPSPYANSDRVTLILGETGTQEAHALKNLFNTFGVTDKKAGEAVKKVLSAMSNWRLAASRNGCSDAEINMFAPVFSDRSKALERAFGL